MAEREGFEPSIRFCRILTFQASAFDHSATAPHRWGSALAPIAGVRPALNANAVSLDLPKMAILPPVSCDMRGALWNESRDEMWPLDRDGSDGGGVYGGDIGAGRRGGDFTSRRDTACRSCDVGAGNANGGSSSAWRAVSAEDGH